MKIVLDQPIAVSVEAAQAAFIDPAFYQSLSALSGISAPEVRSFSQNADHATLVVGYRFVGELNGPAKRLLDPGKITWSQVTEVDLATRRSEVRMVPDNYQGLLSFSGWYELRSEGSDRCSQHFEGDLRIRLPLLGPLAERAIGGSIRQNIAETARLVEQYATGEAKTGGAKTAGAKTGGAKTAGAKTGGAKTGGAKTAGAKTGGAKTAGAKTAGAKTGGSPQPGPDAEDRPDGPGG